MGAIEFGRLFLATLTIAVVPAVASGCGSSSDGARDTGSPRQIVKRAPPGERGKPAANAVPPSHCQADLPSCRTTEGVIIFVERVDPDRDGDAHFVVADSQGITLPGLTAVDVSKELRPRPLPGVGDVISAAGPVQTGSYRQSQIHALELHVAGR